jgi:RNA polymerase sigma factor (sigma-70 family)
MKTSTTPTTASPLPAPRITAAEELVLVARAQAGDRKAVDKLARAHEPFMRGTALRYAQRMGRGCDREEMLSAAHIGFMVALGRFEARHGVRLLTYASHWILHEMQRACETMSLFGHVPSGSEEKAIAAIGRTGSFDADELAESAGVKRTTAANALVYYQAVGVSLDTGVSGFDHGLVLSERLSADEPDAHEKLVQAEEREALRAAVSESLSALDPRSRAIVVETMMSEDTKSLAEMGRDYEISRERARQLASKAKRRLRESIGRRMAKRGDGQVAA